MVYSTTNIELCKLWKHEKTGNVYTVLAVSTCSTNGAKEGEVAVVYSNAEGEVFHRDSVEFLDGRFTPMPSDRLKKLLKTN